MKSLQSFLEAAFNSSAYELILCSGTSPRLRMGRELHVLESQILKASELRALLFEVLDGDQRDQLLKEKVLNTSLHLQNRWVSLHASLHLGGFDVCLSWLPDNVQAYWPNHLASLAVKPSSLSFLQSAQSSASRYVLRYLLDEVLKERPIRGLGFLRNEIGFAAGRGSFSIFDVGSFSRWMQDGESADLVAIECRGFEDIRLATELAQRGSSVIALTTRSQSLPALQALSLESSHADFFRWSLSQVFQFSLSGALIPSLEGPPCLAFDFVAGTEITRKLLWDNKWEELADLVRSSGERTQMRSLNQSLVQLLTKRKIDMKVAFDHSPDPEDLDHFLKKMGV